MLAVLHTRLQRLAKTAEDFRDLTGATWAPKVGAYVCAAHFLEHHLRESPLALLLLAEQVRPAAQGFGFRTRALDHPRVTVTGRFVMICSTFNMICVTAPPAAAPQSRKHPICPEWDSRAIWKGGVDWIRLWWIPERRSGGR